MRKLPPSEKSFAKTMLARVWFRRIRLGLGIRDKLRIIEIPVLLLLQAYVRSRNSFLDSKLGGTLKKLCKDTVMEIEGIKYALLDPGSFDIISREFESFIRTWLKPQQGEVFVDVGANIGKYTLTMARAIGNEGKVVAIEPHPSNFQTLLRNVRLNKLGNVITLNLAAWSKDCELRLFVSHAAGDHSTKTDYGLGWINVKSRAIDHILKEFHLGRVSWIKIDVEGAECEVMLGLEQTIKTSRPKIIVEVFCRNLEWVKKFMKRHGYGLVKISQLLGDHVYFLCLSISL